MMTTKPRQRVENIMDSSGCYIAMFTIGKSNLINCDKRIAAPEVVSEKATTKQVTTYKQT